MSIELTIADVRAAAARLAPFVLRTPTVESAWLGERLNGKVVVKWESQQLTGSFKLRGALNKLLLLKERGVDRVVAVSAGNHGLGVAWAARRLGVRATIVVPLGAARTKVTAIAREGATLVERGRDYDEAERAARSLAYETSTEFVSPYNDLEVIAGAATATLELVEDAVNLLDGPLDALVIPAGGGGLIAGAGVVTRALLPGLALYGAQPANARALHEALRAGRRVEVVDGPTLADGLSGNLEEGTITLPLTQGVVTDVLLVSEARLAEAMRDLVYFEHQVVEGSGAVGVAALLDGQLAGRARVGLLVTGRNVDGDRLRATLDAR